MLTSLALFLFAGAVVAFVLFARKVAKHTTSVADRIVALQGQVQALSTLVSQSTTISERLIANLGLTVEDHQAEISGKLADAEAVRRVMLHELQQVKTRLTWSKKREKKDLKQEKKVKKFRR